MNTGWIVLIEGIAIFGLLIGFGIWQLRSLKKMEREDKAKAEAEDETAESAFTRSREPREESGADASNAPRSAAPGSSAHASNALTGHPER